MGLNTDVHKTVGMVRLPFRSFGVRADKSYTCRMMGAVRSYKERQRERAICPKCRKDLARGSLAAHCQTQHSVAKGVAGQELEGGGWGQRAQYLQDGVSNEGGAEALTS